MEALKIFIAQNGLCYKRKLDAARLGRYFQLNSCSVIDNPKHADYIVFVSCSVKKSREDECFEYIKYFLEFKGELIIAGCLPGIAPERLKQYFHGKCIATKDISEIDSFFDSFKVKFSSVPDANFLFVQKNLPESFLRMCFSYFKKVKSIRKLFLTWLMSVRFKMFWRNSWAKNSLSKRAMIHDAYLRISNGCVEFCTYCGIRLSIGELKSKPMDAVGMEYKALLERGYRSFRIIADNLGAYGTDLGFSFVDLLAYLEQIENHLKTNWFLFSLHPRWAIKYKDAIVERIRSKRIWGLDCPIQSGSNRILKLMCRHHLIEDLIPVISNFREANPNVLLGTHLIVGFPSETEDDFFMSLEAVKKARFDHVYFYPYHDIQLTKASKIDNKVSLLTIEKRMKTGRKYLKRSHITCWYASLYE